MSHHKMIEVTTAFERIAHWLLAVSCLFLMFTGLGLLYQSWPLFGAIFGGAQKMKAIHDASAWVFMVSLLLALMVWFRDCASFNDEDKKWFSKMGGYLTREPVHFNMGKFNPGQKMYFWWIIVGGAVMVLSGLALMYPDQVSRETVQIAGAVHLLAMLVTALFVIVHVYLGTIGNPGSVSAIMSGRVTKSWAKTHRPAWLQKYPNGL